jgi:hypothetical protein
MLGIYEIDHDTLSVCFDEEGKKRPTEFKSAAGSATFVNVHKRAKKESVAVDYRSGRTARRPEGIGRKNNWRGDWLAG